MFVFSEIARLKEVMIHAPGKEVDFITPDAAKQLLFEDIIYGDLARKEHQHLYSILKKFGVKVHYVLDLIVTSLKKSSNETKDLFLNSIKDIENLNTKVLEDLKQLDADHLGSALIEGIFDESYSNYLLNPIPNLLFARDPVLIVGNRAIIAAMKEPVRKREALILSYIFTNHPTLKCDPVQLNNDLNIEGGDFLILDNKTLFIGESLRTSRETILYLLPIFKELGFLNVIIKKLPLKNHFIHLDTVFTRINTHEALVYHPLFDQNDDLFLIDLETNKTTNYNSIWDLFKKIKIELDPIYCGGETNLIAAKREQWSQGANAFTLSPGIIILYSRNVLTINELSKHNYFCISAKEFLKKSFTIPLNSKIAILMNGEELSRARGGPRCLTHPILREG